MIRARLLAGGFAAALAVVALTACGDTTTTPITQLNLDRPVDVSFACFGSMRVTNGSAMVTADQRIVTTAMPTAACEQLTPQVTPRDLPPPDGMGAAKAALPVPGQDQVNGVPVVPSWYSFILQSSSGTVALATWKTKPADQLESGISDTGLDFSVLDADPLTPGKNAISIGEDPIAIVTDKAGCFEVTANAGSCDLSELEINSALDNIGSSTAAATQVRVDRVPIKNAAGNILLARPAAMVAEPPRPPVVDMNNVLLDAGDPVIGNECPGVSNGTGTSHASGKAYVAFPSCHLVAGIDTATGIIFSAISFDPATGAATALTGAALSNAGASCPAECSASGTTPGGAASAGPRPGTLSLKYDLRVDTDSSHPNSKPAPTMRLAIGASNLSKITVVDLDIASFAPTTVLQIPLEDSTANKALGVTTVALSPQIGMGGDATLPQAQQALTDNTPADHQAQFVYAVATDGTVRVADVLNKKHECDTQVDGRFLRNPNLTVVDTMCLDNTTGTLPRHVGARGPGIELPGNGIPTSVAMIKGLDRPPLTLDASNNATSTAQPASPATLVGHFAAISAASGAVYIVNIDDDYAPDRFATASPLDTQPVLITAHQLRDSFTQRDAPPIKSVHDPVSMTDQDVTLCRAIDPPTGGGTAGGPRVSAAPAAVPPTNTISGDLDPELPKLHQTQCISADRNSQGLIGDADKPAGAVVTDLEFGAKRSVRDQTFPDLKSVLNETWTITYEGTLSLDNAVTAIDGPSIREGTIKVNEFGLHLLDQTRPFCDAGVERYDIVDLRGCDPSHLDADCPADYTCFVHPKSNVGIGACVLKSEAQRLSDVCFDFLTTLRRYTVDQTKSGELVLLERKHELPMTPVDGCVSDDQCTAIAKVQAAINPSADPYLGVPSQGHPGTTWSCQNDPLRKPVNTDPAKNLRCVQTCSTDPAHPASCTDGSLCRLNAGSQTEGVCMEGIEPPQSCVNGPQRFDIRASEAFTMIGGISGYIHPIVMQPDGTCGRDPKAPSVQLGRIPLVAPACTNAAGQPPSPNPCQATVPEFEFVPAPNSCSTTIDTSPTGTTQMRDATAIVVSNPAMTLTLVDPTYPGDARCFLDRQGGLGNVPFVNTGFSIQFEQKAGFSPFAPSLFGLVTPVRLVSGPSSSLWVVDDGDFVSSSITQSSTRGRVFRIESSDLVTNILQ